MAGCVADWPETGLCSGHGDCIHINVTTPYCVCHSGWSGNGDWATRDNDCHINITAAIVIWSFTTFMAVIQNMIGTRRVYQWLLYRRHHASLSHHSLWYMFLHDQPFRITVCLWFHGLLLLPLTALHLWMDGPRISQSYLVTVLYAVCYYFMIVAVYFQGTTTFTLSVRIASPVAATQEALLKPMIMAARFTTGIAIIGFGIPLISCGIPSSQDIVTQVWIASVLMGGFVVGITFSYYQYQVVRHLLSPASLTTLNQSQRVERHRVANGIRRTILLTITGIMGNSALIIAVLFWPWSRSRMHYWGGAQQTLLSLVSIATYRTYGPPRYKLPAGVVQPAPATTVKPRAYSGATSIAISPAGLIGSGGSHNRLWPGGGQRAVSPGGAFAPSSARYTVSPGGHMPTSSPHQLPSTPAMVVSPVFRAQQATLPSGPSAISPRANDSSLLDSGRGSGVVIPTGGGTTAIVGSGGGGGGVGAQSVVRSLRSGSSAATPVLSSPE